MASANNPQKAGPTVTFGDGNDEVNFNVAKVGFYGVPPVLRPAAIAVLTGAFGVTGNAIADVGAAFAQATLNNNFRALEDKLNAVLSALQSQGLLQ